jgi:hypothetical protein
VGVTISNFEAPVTSIDLPLFGAEQSPDAAHLAMDAV